MAAATEFINCLKRRGVTFQGESASELRVLGISRLSEQKREILKRHKAAILRALTPPTGSLLPPPAASL